ncbi:hypothetical protein ABOM_001852 [Aspergillus bombycis]|uniref:Aldehyde dehydrogenase domain-containing protein n=1 Tax=Aspergillus bombycis TaxID=109264 RepID=A0A1F8AE50_9EURO|nr:hypothetical protein ABOM_001852 [Aspergillus bombycis]OGM49638.1 hypothetical protein ABOM_001852 [Aspergillus bombycis]
MSSATRQVIPLVINNEDIQTSTTFPVTNPGTGEKLYECSSASLQDVDKATTSARLAYLKWKGWTAYDRQKLLFKAADLLHSRKEELLGYQMEETGAARSFAEMALSGTVDFLRGVAGRVTTIENVSPTVLDPAGAALLRRNAPFHLANRAIALPLAAGNSVILKGSELSPKCFWAITDIYRQAGLPAGCLNTLFHRRQDASVVTEKLIADPAVGKITFTGSTHVGSLLAATAARYIKPVLLELGGKAPVIILDDADLEDAARNCVLGAFMNSGQICMSSERIIVQRSVIDRFRSVLKRTAAEMYGTDTITLVAPEAVNRCHGLVSDALAKGATALVGDVNSIQPALSAMPVFILENIPESADLYATESFGPIATLTVVDTDEDAITLANDTEYGLTGAVFTGNWARWMNIARSIESGAVHINSMTVHDELTLPHGGWKKSGYGRFGGSDGFNEFLQTRTITWKESWR